MDENEIKFSDKPDNSVSFEFQDYEVSAIVSEDLGELASLYRKVYDDVEMVSGMLKSVQAKKEHLAQLLFDRIMSEGLSSIKTSDGSFKAEKTPSCSIIPGREEEVFSRLESIGLGGVIKRQVQWQTLNKLYRDGELSSIIDEDNFKTWDRKAIRIRRT